MKKVTLIARNAQGASAEFVGHSKRDAMRNFMREYDMKGWRFTFYDYYGREL